MSTREGTEPVEDGREARATASSRPLRVLFVTQYFPPETGAAPARALHFARALQRAGHDVRVVTGLPNHPAGEIRPEYRGTWRRSEVVDGIPVERVWLYATPRKTPITRLANHLSFALTTLPVVLSGPRPDVVLATTPPLFHGLTGWLAAKLRGAALEEARHPVEHARDQPLAHLAERDRRVRPVVAAVVDERRAAQLRREPAGQAVEQRRRGGQHDVRPRPRQHDG